MSEDLNPCPFCMGRAIRRERVWYKKSMYKYGVGCRDCLCELMGFKSQSGADKAWNARHQEPLHACTCKEIIGQPVSLVTKDIWRCPRCGGVGVVIKPKVSVEEIKESLIDLIFVDKNSCIPSRCLTLRDVAQAIVNYLEGKK